MPGTWANMRARFALGTDPHDPRDKILAVTAYLRPMYDRFGYPGLFAAYNAGPVRYARHLTTGRPLPRETITYLVAVTGGPGTHGARVSQHPEPAVPTLFAVPVRAIGAASAPAERRFQPGHWRRLTLLPAVCSCRCIEPRAAEPCRKAVAADWRPALLPAAPDWTDAPRRPRRGYAYDVTTSAWLSLARLR